MFPADALTRAKLKASVVKGTKADPGLMGICPDDVSLSSSVPKARRAQVSPVNFRFLFPYPLPTMAEAKRDVRNPLLFECAWEVANKVGGIYTVIKTKVPVTVQEFGDRYCLIGPLSYKSAPMEVEAQEPQDPYLAASLDAMRQRGVKCLYGRWLIEGAPRVLLFDTGSQYSRIDEWKGDLWNLAGIPTPPNDHETNETIVFGYMVAWFLGEVRTR